MAGASRLKTSRRNSVLLGLLVSVAVLFCSCHYFHAAIFSAFLLTSSTATTSRMSNFTLPVLPYDYQVLEPYVDKETMIIHHTKHHQAYVDNLNASLQAQVITFQSLYFGHFPCVGR